MPVLITRPDTDAQSLRAEVEALGYRVLVEPLLRIEPLPAASLDLDDVQALVLTSAHAVAALAGRAKTLPVFAVGQATARAARGAGCRRVMTAAGDVQGLSQLLIEKCRPEHGVILHLSGEIVRQGLEERLVARGFSFRRQAVYRAVAAERLSDDLVASWRRRAVGAVLLFSPRTAEILVRLLIRHNLEGHVDTTAAICLSVATAAPCRVLEWRTVQAAVQPNRHALLKALVRSYATC